MREPGGGRRRIWPSVIPAAVALAALAILLAWPVPVTLSRASWPTRAPATALLLWQAIALAGGLSMIGSLLMLGLAPFGDNLVAGLGAVVPELVALDAAVPRAAIAPNLLALAAAAGLGIYLVMVLSRTAALIERQRQGHRRLVRLLSTPLPDRPHTRLLDLAAPVAYCLPGAAGSVTVLSAGLLDLLDEDELRAVVEHEKAHLLQRHHIVLTAFEAWHRSLPRFPIASRSRREVGMLVEMLADDHARRTVDDRTLAKAIVLAAAGPGSASASNPAGGPRTANCPETGRVPMADLQRSSRQSVQLHARVERLLGAAAPLPIPARSLVVATAVALIAVPTVLLFAPALGA